MNTKKLISFSIWGLNPKYVDAAIENVYLQRELYPDWTCRFYVDDTVPENVINTLKDLGSEIVMMSRSIGFYGLFWRFLPLDESGIERFIVRDTDSRLSLRERAAVQEWEESGKPFHIMRDNFYHGVVPICGGMWGATKEFKPNYKSLLDKWLANNAYRSFLNPRGRYFFNDQSFLKERIWPLIRHNHIAHIKDLPNLKYTGNERLFPIENPDGTFVGQPID